MGREAACVPKAELLAAYGTHEVDRALDSGWLAQSFSYCTMRRASPLCWLTEKGKKQLSRAEGLDRSHRP